MRFTLLWNVATGYLGIPPKGAYASPMVYTMVEMAKAPDLNIYKYLNFLLERLPGTVMMNDELSKLVPWNETVQEICTSTI